MGCASSRVRKLCPRGTVTFPNTTRGLPIPSVMSRLPAFSFVIPAVAATLAGVLATPGAWAQSALGDGTRLDRSLLQGSDGRNLPRTVTDFQLRNDLVTGNVAGGAQFRGDVGYTSPRAFRGFAGSDSLFEFRSGSALSSLPAVQGGWTADRFSLATDSIIKYQRDTTPSAIRPHMTAYTSDADARALIQRATAQGTIVNALARSSDGQLLGGMQDAQGQQRAVLGSPVTGLRFEPVQFGEIRMLDMGLYDWRRFEHDRQNRPAPGSGALADGGLDSLLPGRAGGDAGDPFGERAGERTGDRAGDRAGARDRQGDAAGRATDLSLTRDAALAAGRREEMSTAPPPVDARRELSVAARAYDDVVKELVQRYAERTDVRVSVAGAELQAALRSELDRLSADLRGAGKDYDRVFPGIRPPAALPPGSATASAERTADGVDGGLRSTIGPTVTPPSLGPEGDQGATGLLPVEGEEATGAAPEPAAAERMPVDELAALLRPRGTVTTLTPQQKTQVEEFIARGEARLREGEYFLAEQLFDRALRIAPGHPMAQIGVVHANLGAGLYLSAAVQLRQIIADQPAMVGLKFDPALLPPQARLEQNLRAIRELMGRSTIDRNDYALMLAYLAHQLDGVGGRSTVEQMREGLDAIQGGNAEETLRLLLKKVWLGE